MSSKSMMQSGVYVDDTFEVDENFDWTMILQKMTFHPNNRAYRIWNIIISFVSLISSIFYAEMIAEPLGTETEIFNWINIILFIVEFIFLIDIILRFFKAYDE